MIVLAIDVGTSSVKSSLVSDKGEILDTATVEYATRSIGRSMVEQDANLWWEGAVKGASALLGKNAGRKDEVAVIGVCGHMLGCLPVGSDGEPLRPAMIHADTRSSAEMEQVARAIERDKLYDYTGCILSAQSPLCKTLWLKNNEPEIYRKTARFLQSKDFIVSKLTGNMDVTDFSDASHAQLINIHTKAYLGDLFGDLGLDAGRFPAIRKGTDVVGTLTPGAAKALGLREGVPVIAGGGDGACANVGAGVSGSVGNAYISLGTTAWISYNSDIPVIDPKARIFDIMSLDGESFGVFGTMQAAGKCVEWAMELFGVANGKEFDAEAAKSAPGSDGLLFLPYIDGERSPIFDANARGVFFNINSTHSRSHFTRAVLEGVAFNLRTILDVYRENRPFGDLRIIGGGANSKLWKKAIAGILNARVDDISAHANSVTSLGVALAACVGAGFYRDLGEAAENITVTGSTEPEDTALYNELHDKFVRLYPAVKALY